MAEVNGRRPFVKFLAAERARMAEFRTQLNALIDTQMKLIDEAEVRYSKEQEGKSGTEL